MLSESQLERASEWYRRGYLDAIYNRHLPRSVKEVPMGSFAHHDYYNGLNYGADDKRRFQELLARQTL